MDDARNLGDLAFVPWADGEEEAERTAAAEHLDELLGDLPSVSMVDDQLVALIERAADAAESDGLSAGILSDEEIELRDRLLDLRLLVDVPDDLAKLGDEEIQRRIIAIRLFRMRDAARAGRWVPEDG